MKMMWKIVILCDSGAACFEFVQLFAKVGLYEAVAAWKLGFRLFILICPAVDQLFVHSVSVLCYGDKAQLLSSLIVNLQNLE